VFSSDKMDHPYSYNFFSTVFIPLTARCDNAPGFRGNAVLTERDRLRKMQKNRLRERDISTPSAEAGWTLKADDFSGVNL
ncbi:MAG: hypothetical protein PHW56_09490, partial [Methanosarcinaceae archaeon]|nr:hypothetical protein [Methanosarcinaceae archaeon]